MLPRVWGGPDADAGGVLGRRFLEAGVSDGSLVGEPSHTGIRRTALHGDEVGSQPSVEAS